MDVLCQYSMPAGGTMYPGWNCYIFWKQNSLKGYCGTYVKLWIWQVYYSNMLDYNRFSLISLVGREIAQVQYGTEAKKNARDAY